MVDTTILDEINDIKLKNTKDIKPKDMTPEQKLERKRIWTSLKVKPSQN